MSKYKEAGVDIEKGDAVASFIAEKAKSTFSSNVLKGIGSFCSFFDLRTLLDHYPDPVIVSSTDGVGTKLKLATELNNHKGVGHDLVGMCVNDILTCGATPLFFLDYFATGKLDEGIAKEVLTSITDACVIANCSLVGGETAEMPGFYDINEYDLAGFTVGIVNKPDIIDGRTITKGNSIIGLRSNGLHSNGYSLVRQICKPLNKEEYYPELHTTLGTALLAPTIIYAKIVKYLLTSFPSAILGMAHITGGGFSNILRILPNGLDIAINKTAWEIPPIFKLLQEKGNISNTEMYEVFNMGIGYVLIVPKSHEDLIISKINAIIPLTAFRIGEVI
jgi:phosphoribosylformylglycinamidine cyclo-ligase